MSNVRLHAIATLLGLFCAIAHAQQSQSAAIVPDAAPVRTGAVPNVIRFSGSFRPSNGQPTQPVESVTLSVYRDQVGGTALWQETQNVAMDGGGKYSVLMGATQNEGVPMDLLSAGEPRWLGVQFNRPGEVEQPRVLMASVPYALKSVDAETLGGKPASAYLLAPVAAAGTSTNLTGNSVSSSVEMAAHGAAPPGAAPPLATVGTATTAVKPRTISGTQNYIPVFTDASNDLGNSVMQQFNGSVGIGTVPGAGAPTAPSLDVRTSPFSQIGMAQTVDYLTFFASDAYGPAIYWDPTKDLRFGKGGSGLYNPFGFVEQMRIQSSTGNVGIGTQLPASALDVAEDINFGSRLLYQNSPILQRPGGIDSFNVAVGVGAMQFPTGGIQNTAIGDQTLQQGGSGDRNTAVGFRALGGNGFGNDNTAIGNLAMLNNNIGVQNTAVGSGVLANFSTTSGNTAVGYQALQGGTPANANTGSLNTASGLSALQNNTTGNSNTASGADALYSNTIGNFNTAVGNVALGSNTAGGYNAAIGEGALYSNISGSYNTAIGVGALENAGGSNNIAIGYNAGGSVDFGGGNNNIFIGNPATFGDNGAIRIGAPGTHTSFFAAGVNGVTTTNSAVPVLIDTTTGQLGVASSSRRYKEDIEDMGEASRDLMRLRPVTFRYKKPFADGSKPLQYGLIAEEVDEVYPDLVAHSSDGQIETVKYQVLDSMLLNEVQRQQAEIGAQKEQLQKLEQRLNAQTEQNVSLQERLDKLEAMLSAASRASGVAAVR